MNDHMDSVITAIIWLGMDSMLKEFCKLKITCMDGKEHTILTSNPSRFSVCKNLAGIMNGEQ